MFHTKLPLIALIAIIAGLQTQRYPDKKTVSGTGGEVNGSVFYLAPVISPGHRRDDHSYSNLPALLSQSHSVN